eukprot:COSAG01_NODE_37834_length_498_cov_0.884712_1_plen_79_part_10
MRRNENVTFELVKTASTEQNRDTLSNKVTDQSYYKVPAFEKYGGAKSTPSDLVIKKAKGSEIPQIAQNSKRAVQQSRGA